MLALNEVQVVLCDQRMPTMSGSQFLDRVKDLHPDTMRIILSGYADFESIIDSINRWAIYGGAAGMSQRNGLRPGPLYGLACNRLR